MAARAQRASSKSSDLRLNAPRIEPVDLDRLDADQRAALEPFLASDGGKVGGGKILNIFRTLARAPKALTAFLGWGNYILSKRNALSPRDRELVILRTGYNCRSGYEWTQHKRIGLDSGLTADEIQRIKDGPDADGWSDIDRAMLRAIMEPTLASALGRDATADPAFFGLVDAVVDTLLVSPEAMRLLAEARTEMARKTG